MHAKVWIDKQSIGSFALNILTAQSGTRALWRRAQLAQSHKLQNFKDNSINSKAIRLYPHSVHVLQPNSNQFGVAVVGQCVRYEKVNRSMSLDGPIDRVYVDRLSMI